MFGRKREVPAAPVPAPPPAPSMDEQIKMNRRKIDRACRELDRERQKMEMQERKVTAEIKKVAAANQIESARMLSKDLARTRAHISKMYQMRTQMQSVSMQMSAMKTQEMMAGTMGNIVQMMTTMNRGMNLPAMQKVLMQFDMEQGQMEMIGEMMDDSLGDMAGAEENAEADRILQEVLAEQSQAVAGQVGAYAPSTGAGPIGVEGSAVPPSMQEMESRLAGRH
jgi:charged multivesicular body protein 2A